MVLQHTAFHRDQISNTRFQIWIRSWLCLPRQLNPDRQEVPHDTSCKAYVCVCERERDTSSLFQTWEVAELQLQSTGITGQYSQSEPLCHSALCAWKHSGLKFGTGASPTQAAFMRKWLTSQAYANKSIHHPPTQTSHPNSQFCFHS